MRKALLLAVLFAANAVQAGVGVTIGHREMGEDGLPKLAKGEVVTVFHCRASRMTGDELQACARKKCLSKFGQDGKCIDAGWTEKPGYALIVSGPKGNNQYLMSMALGAADKAEARKIVAEEEFPFDEGKILLEFRDSGK